MKMILLLPVSLIGAHIYLFFRLWHLIPAGVVRTAVMVLVAAAFASMFASVLLGSRMPVAVASFCYTLGTTWLMIVPYLTLALLTADLLRLTHLVPLDRLMSSSWTGFGVLTATMLLIFTAGHLNYLHKKRVELDIELPAEKSLAQPLKIVAASDLHLGHTIGRRELARWVERINAEQPDLVLLAGDILDNDLRPVVGRNLAAVLRELHAPLGVYACPGNHEYISGITGSLAFLKDAGIQVLQDSVIEVGGLRIAGRDDRAGRRRRSLPDLLAGTDASSPVILLDHQPYRLEEAETSGVTLQLSGHTHHGQIWPFSLVTDAMFENAYGYLKKGDTHYYVTSGLGIWGGKFRIGTRSEYVVFQLKVKS